MGHNPPMGYGVSNGLQGPQWAMGPLMGHGPPMGYGVPSGLWGHGWAMGPVMGYGANDGLWGY